jgi:hypothetical protein
MSVSTLAFFVPEGIDTDEVEYLFYAFEDRAPIARYPTFDSTGKEVHMDFVPSLDVGFGRRAPRPIWGHSIPDTLRLIHRHITNKVLPRLVCFLN